MARAKHHSAVGSTPTPSPSPPFGETFLRRMTFALCPPEPAPAVFLSPLGKRARVRGGVLGRGMRSLQLLLSADARDSPGKYRPSECIPAHGGRASRIDPTTGWT